MGGRLIPRLLETGYRIRCTARDTERLKGHPWLSRVEFVQGNALNREPLGAAMQGVSTVWLRQGCVPVTEFRAGVIIAPGSISFEMIRYLTEQFPLPGVLPLL